MLFLQITDQSALLMKNLGLKVLPSEAGKRIDLFIADFSKKDNLGLSRQAIQKLILKNSISLKGPKSIKPHYKIKAGDEILIGLQDQGPSTLEAEDLPLEVLYEDQDLAIINKPSGLVVHPGPGNYEHTLVNALLHRFKELSDINPLRPGIVHRLDKQTSGLLVIAKSNVSHLNLAEQFARHSIKRKYIALVKGNVECDENIIEIPIGRHPFKRKNMSAGFTKKARYAKTYYRTLKRTAALSLLELEPFTGRTHQLRVHLAFIGHPILGDTKYGKDNASSRLCLHALSIGFVHPRTGKEIEFRSSIPEEMRELMELHSLAAA